MFLVLFILFALQQQMQCNSAFRYPQDNRTFVNWRKNELREKNEDYGDVAGGAKSNAKGPGLGLPGKETPARSAAEAFRKKIHFNDESREVKSGGLVQRRSFDNPPRVPPLSPVFSKRPKLNHKHRSRAPPLEPQPASTPLAPTLPPAEDSLSRLLRTNPPPSLPDERMTQRKPRLNAALAGPKLHESPKLREGPKLRVVGSLPPAVFAHKPSKEENHERVLTVPDPNQLDMAQAVGGHVPSMRYKNRLCSRHVLIPEGPKYDSRGAVYLPAYSVKPPRGIDTARDYAATSSPRQLLPKCCNCCKKSVLGCE